MSNSCCCFPPYLIPSCLRRSGSSKERTPLLRLKKPKRHRSEAYVAGTKEDTGAIIEEATVLSHMKSEPSSQESASSASSECSTSSDAVAEQSSPPRNQSHTATSTTPKSRRRTKSHYDTKTNSHTLTTPKARRRTGSQIQSIQSPHATRIRNRQIAEESFRENHGMREEMMAQASNRKPHADDHRVNIKILVDQWLESSGEDRMDALHELYRAYDEDSDDSITRTQFRHFYKDFYRELFLIPIKKEYKQMVQQLDEQHEDDISFKEFRKYFDAHILSSVEDKIQKRTIVRQLMSQFFASPPERDENGYSEEEAQIYRFYTVNPGESNEMNREGFSVLVKEACAILGIPFDSDEQQEMIRDMTQVAFGIRKDGTKRKQPQKRIHYEEFSRAFNDHVLPKLYTILVSSLRKEESNGGVDSDSTMSEEGRTPYSVERRSMPTENAVRLKKHGKKFMPPSLRRGKSTLFRNYVFETNIHRQRDILLRLFKSFDDDEDGILTRRELALFLLSLFSNFDMKDQLTKEDVINTYDLLANPAVGGVRYDEFEAWWESMIGSFQSRESLSGT